MMTDAASEPAKADLPPPRVPWVRVPRGPARVRLSWYTIQALKELHHQVTRDRSFAVINHDAVILAALRLASLQENRDALMDEVRTIDQAFYERRVPGE